MHPYVEILRPVNCLMAAASTWIGFLVASTTLFSPPLLFALIAAFLICGGGQVINDYFDYHIDRKKAPKKPLPSHRIPPDFATYYAFSLFGLGIIAAFFAGVIPLVIAVLYTGLLVQYSARLRERKWVGNLIVASATGVTLLFGASITGITPLLLLLAFMAFFSNLGREIIKDCADLEVDQGQKITLPMSLPLSRVQTLVGMLFLAAVLLSYYAYIVLGFGGGGYLAAVTLSNLGFGLSFKSLHSHSYIQSHTRAKSAMVVALLAFLLGGLNI